VIVLEHYPVLVFVITASEAAKVEAEPKITNIDREPQDRAGCFCGEKDEDRFTI